MSAPRRILLVRLSHLGDVVHALPVHHALRRAFPDAELAWAVQHEFADLLRGLPGLARTFLFGRREGFAAWARLRREFAAWRPDWSVDAQGNTKSAMVCLTSGARRRSGLARSDWRERLASLTTTHRAAPAEGPHAVDRAIALSRHVTSMAWGAQGEDPDRAELPAPSFELGLTEEELYSARVDLASDFEGCSAGGTPDWIVHLSHPGDIRAWPLEHFEEVIRALLAADRAVLVMSGPGEAEAGAALATRIAHPRVSHWIGQQGLRHLAAILAVTGESGGHMLACDSGPAHLAAACGLPVQFLAGPQDPERTGPWPRAIDPDPFHGTLRHPEPPDCAPCLARRCSHPSGPVCLSALEPGSVARILLRLPTSRPRPDTTSATPT